MDHLQAARGDAAGAADGFAAAKAAYRFFDNDRVSLPALAGPLQSAAESYVAKHRPSALLVLHDWSAVKYKGHESKRDQVRLSNEQDVGYELLASLAVDGGMGDPIAPLHLQLRAADRTHSTRLPAPKRGAFWLDELGKTMAAVARLKLGATVVHVVDREGDSLAHYREWHAAGRSFLVRVDDDRLVLHEGVERKLPAILQALDAAGSFAAVGAASRRGDPCTLEVAETDVVLHRPAWRHRTVGAKTNERIAGPPLPMRFVVARLRGEGGKVEAAWLLFTNAAAEYDAATVARWYYFRWRIETFFKLLKSAGMALEDWQQETAARIARRLLVACMACVVVWRLERATAADDVKLRDTAMKLSERLTKPDRRWTAPALLAGLWRLMGALLLLETHSAEDLVRMGATLHALLPRSNLERDDSS
jgi:hypothetical protein